MTQPSRSAEEIYLTKSEEIDLEAQAARALIQAIIEDTSTASDNFRLGRIDDRIENVNGDLRRNLNEENDRIMPQLEAGNFQEIRTSLVRADALRDQFSQKVEEIRKDMMAQVRSDSVVTMRDQQTAILISLILTVLAAILGLMFSLFISTGITTPVRGLLEGTRGV